MEKVAKVICDHGQMTVNLIDRNFMIFFQRKNSWGD